MKHIRQKDLSIYTIVITNDWDKSLEEHYSIVEHPELFEVVECDLPDYIQYVIYSA